MLSGKGLTASRRAPIGFQALLAPELFRTPNFKMDPEAVALNLALLQRVNTQLSELQATKETFEPKENQALLKELTRFTRSQLLRAPWDPCALAWQTAETFTNVLPELSCQRTDAIIKRARPYYEQALKPDSGWLLKPTTYIPQKKPITALLQEIQQVPALQQATSKERNLSVLIWPASMILGVTALSALGLEVEPIIKTIPLVLGSSAVLGSFMLGNCFRISDEHCRNLESWSKVFSKCNEI
jgi:hypothetical protein